MRYAKGLLVSSCCALFLISGCKVFKTAPPIPDVVFDQTPSFDGNERNSGLIDYVEGRGYLITPNAAARYNHLIQIYGDTYIPPIKPGDGLTPDPEGGNYYLDSQHMVEFMVMNQKFKSSIEPRPPEETEENGK